MNFWEVLSRIVHMQTCILVLMCAEALVCLPTDLAWASEACPGVSEDASGEKLFHRGRALANADKWRAADRCLSAASSANYEQVRLFLEWSWAKFHLGEHREAHDLALRATAESGPTPLAGVAYYNAGRALESLAKAADEEKERRALRQRAANYYTFSLNFREHEAVQERREKLLARDDVREEYRVKSSPKIAESSFRSACEMDLDISKAESPRAVCERFTEKFRGSRTSGDGTKPKIDGECDVSNAYESEGGLEFHMVRVKAWEGSCLSGGQGSEEPLYVGVQTKSGFRFARVMTLSQGVCDHYRQGSMPEIGEPKLTTADGVVRLSLKMAYIHHQGESASMFRHFTRRYRLECHAGEDEEFACQRLPVLFSWYRQDDGAARRFTQGSPQTPIVEGANMRAKWEATKGGTFRLVDLEGHAPSCMPKP